MHYKANLPIKIRCRLFQEAFQAAALLDGLVTTKENEKLTSRYQH
jgi:hypothetical protein